MNAIDCGKLQALHDFQVKKLHRGRVLLLGKDGSRFPEASGNGFTYHTKGMGIGRAAYQILDLFRYRV